jgi:hypothetical protein
MDMRDTPLEQRYGQTEDAGRSLSQ